MLAAERHARIKQALRDAPTVATTAVAAELGVSLETVRRDLVDLERAGALTRVHGGATRTVMPVEEAPFRDRSTSERAAKKAIGHAAATLLVPGQTVVIDVGTTAVQVARAIPRDFRGTVATCSVLVATELAEHPDVEVLVSGGRMRRGDLALSGAQATAFFADVHADIAFLGSGGVHARHGLTDYHLDEVATRRTIIANSAASWVLADHTKLGRTTTHGVAHLDQITGIVTDTEPPTDLADALADAGARVITP